MKIEFDQPAKQWEEALPVGNGKLGGMIFGNPCTERIQLNEDSVRYGGPQEHLNSSAKEKLPQIRSLIIEGKIKEAQELCALALSGLLARALFCNAGCGTLSGGLSGRR